MDPVKFCTKVPTVKNGVKTVLLICFYALNRSTTPIGEPTWIICGRFCVSAIEERFIGSEDARICCEWLKLRPELKPSRNLSTKTSAGEVGCTQSLSGRQQDRILSIIHFSALKVVKHMAKY